MTHYMKLNAQPFQMVKSGYKTIELRLNDDKRKSLMVGDTIIFSDINEPQNRISVVIVKIHTFLNFNELYKTLPLDKCGYLPDQICSASSSDMEKYYSVAEQNKYGVLGIEFEITTI